MNEEDATEVLFDKCLQLIKEGIETTVQTSVCESPIERLLATAFLLEEKMEIPIIRIKVMCWAASDYLWATEWAVRCIMHGHAEIFIFAQTKIDNYRVDFFCVGMNRDSQPALLAIECDGHDFHERTKFQAQRDKLRDRTLLAKDIPVMRFTGSEVWKDARACVNTVANYFYKQAVDNRRLIND